MYMFIKKAEKKDLDVLANAAATCFPAAEAASKERIEGRLSVYPDYFWIGRDEFHELVCYAAGPVTKEGTLTDNMYADPSVHDPNGDWQMIFSLCTMPEYRHKGMAALLLQRVISQAEEAGRKGVVLACKEHMIPYYERFGFVNEGLSESKHGGATWYQMRLTFDEDYYLARMFQVSDNPDDNIQAIENAVWNLLC